MKALLDKLCARIRIIRDTKTVNNGSGTILYIDGKYYLFTAYHCIYGDKKQFADVTIEEIRIEVQEAFNTPMIAQTAKEITATCEGEDWGLIELEMNIDGYPNVINTNDFKIDASVNFRGFQKVNDNSGRTFDCIVKEMPSKNEFKVTLGPNDEFKDGADEAKGLSGSGVFIVAEDKLYLIGLLKSVKGHQALNDDILCCSVEVLAKVFPNSFDKIIEKEVDEIGAQSFDYLEISDSRNIIDKLRDVCPEIMQVRINKYCQDIALGQAELEMYSERTISAMKFRIFDACQDELMSFIENHQEEKLSVAEVKKLLDDFTNRAVEIIKIKSDSYKYATKDRDIIRKIVLELINECYLSFDKTGIYGY